VNAKETHSNGPIIVLVGMMGSGKSSVGAKVARKIDAEFLDTDEMICQRTKLTVRELFSTIGEPAFRDIESSVLIDAIDTHTDGRGVVIATGGGAVLSQQNRSLIVERAQCVVWLDAPVEDLVLRTRNGKNRPLLDGDTQAALQPMYENRKQLYDEVSTLRINSHSMTVDEVAKNVADAITAETRS
jgi:shikimate kinase